MYVCMCISCSVFYTSWYLPCLGGPPKVRPKLGPPKSTLSARRAKGLLLMINNEFLYLLVLQDGRAEGAVVGSSKNHKQFHF